MAADRFLQDPVTHSFATRASGQTLRCVKLRTVGADAPVLAAPCPVCTLKALGQATGLGSAIGHRLLWYLARWTPLCSVHCDVPGAHAGAARV